MKWVKIGVIVAVAGGAVGSYASRSAVPMVATTSVAVVMWYMYEHAKKSGLENGGPSTETYSGAF